MCGGCLVRDHFRSRQPRGGDKLAENKNPPGRMRPSQHAPGAHLRAEVSGQSQMFLMKR